MKSVISIARQKINPVYRYGLTILTGLLFAVLILLLCYIVGPGNS